MFWKTLQQNQYEKVQIVDVNNGNRFETYT
ncbi:TPA: aspartate 1-decarboxylase, partial [Enterococcus faecium]|nr:aspartate 1-decarboxylase [Enterococcus faecium]